jgi:hypothetical protein
MKKSTQKHIARKQERFYQQYQKKLQKEEKNNNNFQNNKSNIMTRIDRIIAIKNSNEHDITKGIDLHACTDSEINGLYTIVENKKKGINRSASEWSFVAQLRENKNAYKSIGKFS